MDNPRRPPTYSFFVTKEQCDLLLRALDSMEETHKFKTVTEVMHRTYLEIRQKLVNIRDAIKRLMVREQPIQKEKS